MINNIRTLFSTLNLKYKLTIHYLNTKQDLVNTQGDFLYKISYTVITDIAKFTEFSWIKIIAMKI